MNTKHLLYVPEVSGGGLKYRADCGYVSADGAEFSLHKAGATCAECLGRDPAKKNGRPIKDPVFDMDPEEMTKFVEDFWRGYQPSKNEDEFDALRRALRQRWQRGW